MKSDVQKRTSTESMPLLIDDRVSLLGLFHIKSFLDVMQNTVLCILTWIQKIFAEILCVLAFTRLSLEVESRQHKPQ